MCDPLLFRLNQDPAVSYNMCGDYTYLKEGYYHSLDDELAGVKIKPTMEEMLDAYVVPLTMEKANLAGINIPRYEILTEKIPSPVLAYPINPFTTKEIIIKNPEEAKTKIKTLTMGGKFAMLCQYLPDNYQIVAVHSILGWTANDEFQELAQDVFRVFQIPLMRIIVIVDDKHYLFSAIKPLSLKELAKEERCRLEEVGMWQE
ncbi:MAG: RimK-like ATPgrasp N-terminal domain-containing protein [Clostridia bacterium]|jgi:hypothetical protein|nr:RimK-like ATPgrasp N-terminal domain-containing protein [Clostridia bacterium]MDD4146192.1 RimK-like ATPgrasp N-terminal domain-containing protein [Clostridia bacterium]MDD4665984.1 RimK-like ATPgrasp N-terminal domain-containing protein [Clostridia bacterium]